MSNGAPLGSRLADVLPRDWKARIYHVSTPPTASSPILAALPNQTEQPTFRESHFLALASPPLEGCGHSGNADADGSGGGHPAVLLYALEVLIFATATLTTVFVSKADSSGFRPKLNANAHDRILNELKPKPSGSIVQAVTQAFLDYLLAPRLQKSKVVISLFARSQHQYLFPGSIENAEKHVLNDRQLIKWWCKILDRVWRPYDDRSTSPSHQCHKVTAYLMVPGCDKVETRLFFPPSAKLDSPESPKWVNSYPESFITGDGEHGLPPRCVIPRLPDDPKSRFLDDLDSDYVGPDGHWRSVKSLAQFWEMMAYRQECHAGNLVGFVWITFQRDSLEPTAKVSAPKEGDGTVILPEVHAPSSPLQPQHTNGALEKHSSTQPTTHVTGNASSKGEAVLSQESYDLALDFLLQLDFTGVDSAAQSTKKWIQKVLELAPGAEFGETVVGRHVAVDKDAQPVPHAAADSAPEANLLTGVRKKRKVDDETGSIAPPTQQQVNMLSSVLIRKKPKNQANS